MHSLHLSLVTIAAALTFTASLPAATQKTSSSPASGPILHKVAKGETMWSISQKHHTSVGEIMEYNQLQSHIVREGMTLKIPTRKAVTPGKTNDAALPRPVSRESIHIVKSGETFWSIAEKYKINPQALAQANPNVNPNRMHPDMELTVPSAQLAAPAPKTTPKTSTSTSTAPSTSTTSSPAPVKAGATEYVLSEGETFYSISRKHGLKLADLLAANPGLKPERLRPGIKIQLPGGTAARPSATSTASDTTTKKPTSESSTPSKSQTQPPALVVKRHTVVEGESLASIAKKYSISTDALLKQNNLKETDSIYIGDVLSIPGVSAPSTTSKTASTASSSSSSETTKAAAASNAKPSTPSSEPRTAATEANPGNGQDLNGSNNSNTTPNPSKSRMPFEVADDGSVRSYIVSAGETEDTICEAFGITKKELFEHNKLSQGSQLRPGDEIMIPPTTKKVVSR